ncbi:MAG: DUF4832 domain-containing protein [Ignavibacteria bacterium]|jgi:hypothetical protein
MVNRNTEICKVILTACKVIAILFFCVLSINGQDISRTTVFYEESDEIFRNPERGFSAARSSQISRSFINNIKDDNITVIQRIYTVPQFNSVLFTDDFLNLVESDLNTAREGGVKLVLRFSYTNNQNGDDAALELILSQIEQLKPVFNEHYDVIAYIEAGFIGAWGEWYYSTNGLNNTESRRTVLYALLDALPVERKVVVRTPGYKRSIYGTDEPLTFAEAFNGTKRARTGAHNDCFLASATDFGTYVSNDVEGDKSYLNLDNRFVPQGGETCNPGEYSSCVNALIDLERMHWSVLNRDYHQTVLDSWVTGGCMDEIKRRLGYRFRLIETAVIDSLKPGGTFNMSCEITNEGYAGPYNKRNLEVVLKNKDTNKKYRLLTDEDPRFWLSGDTAGVEITGGVKTNVPEGDYGVYIFMSDPEEGLREKPDYAIRLANKDLWEDSTGFNYLLHDLVISSDVQSEDYNGDSYFEIFDQGTVVPTGEINIDGSFNDWEQVQSLDTGEQEKTGDALNDALDLDDMWITEDEDWIYISYMLAGDFSESYFYHVFFDIDNNPTTGYHTAESYAGIDFMIENQYLWKYSGENGEWGWTSKGEVDFKIGTVEKNRVELAVSKNSLEIDGSQTSLELIFNINDNDESHDDDYAPDNYKTESYTYNFTVTSVEEQAFAARSSSLEVLTYPNPFNNEVTILFNANSEEIISAGIYDLLGRRVKTYSPSQFENGRFFWNGRNNNGRELSSGTYFFYLQTEKEKFVKKMLLIK